MKFVFFLPKDTFPQSATRATLSFERKMCGSGVRAKDVNTGKPFTISQMKYE